MYYESYVWIFPNQKEIGELEGGGIGGGGKGMVQGFGGGGGGGGDSFSWIISSLLCPNNSDSLVESLEFPL